MKHTLFILALITATIQTFAQSPRIKLNQITKDSLTGSVLISSPTDSGMVYSRDLFISYGADTVLILGGDTLAKTSGIISSVLSDGVTIIGDGTTGSELTVDTNTVIATKQDLDLKQDQLNGTGFVKATGTTISYDNSTYLTSEVDGSVTNEGSLTVGAGGANDAVISSNTSGSSDVTISGGTNVTVTESGQTITIASSGGAIPVDTFVTIAGTETITGAKTFSTAIVVNENGDNVDTRLEGDTDANLLFLDASENRVGIGTSSPSVELDVEGDVTAALLTSENQVIANNTGTDPTNNTTLTNGTVYSLNGVSTNNNFGIGIGAPRNNNYDIWFQTGGVNGGGYRFYRGTSELVTITNSGDVGIGTTSPGSKLHVKTSTANDVLLVEDDSGVCEAQPTTTGLTWSCSSDQRLKTNITEAPNILSYVTNIPLKQYNVISTYESVLGPIAQELLETYTELVSIGEDGFYRVSSLGSWTIVKAIQEQQAIIESQALEIEQLKSQIQLILSEIEQIKNN